MPTPEAVFAIIVFSIIGFAAFRSGKREADWKGMVIGVVLMVYPYFVENAWALWLVGIGLTAAWFCTKER